MNNIGDRLGSNMKVKQEKKVAELVGGDFPETNKKHCIDKFNRIWHIKHRHSGAILTGVNHKAVIPYWTSYFVSLPELKLINLDDSKNIKIIPELPTLLSEIKRLKLSHDNIVKDRQHNLLWVIRFSSEDGLISLDGYNDNHWLPASSLDILSFGGLIWYE